MKRVTDMITHNFRWKMVSLLAAVVVWFLIVNITNPTRDQSIHVYLRVDGAEALLENNLILFNADELESEIIVLTVHGTAASLRQAEEQDRSDGTLYAYIDLSPIDISRSSDFGKRMPINVKYGTYSQSYTVLNSRPGTVEVVIDRLVTRTYPVIIEKIDDDAQGYITSEPVVMPEFVTISGPESIMDNIIEVRGEIEVGGATEPFETIAAIEVLNIDGRDISSRLNVSAKEVYVYVNVGTFARIPVSVPETIGRVADGYRVTHVLPAPRDIEVEGHSADILAMNAIRLMPIDINGLTRTKIETYDIRAYLEGTGLSIREGNEGLVRVTVTVEREITKEILVPVDQIEIRGATENVSLYATEVVRLEVQGIAAEIVEFEQSQFVCFIDVTDLEAGVHRLEVYLQTPEGIIQIGTEEIEVFIGGEDYDGETDAGETALGDE